MAVIDIDHSLRVCSHLIRFDDDEVHVLAQKTLDRKFKETNAENITAKNLIKEWKNQFRTRSSISRAV